MSQNRPLGSEWGSGERLVVHDTGSFASGLNSQLDSLAEGRKGFMDASNWQTAVSADVVLALVVMMGMVVMIVVVAAGSIVVLIRCVLAGRRGSPSTGPICFLDMAKQDFSRHAKAMKAMVSP